MKEKGKSIIKWKQNTKLYFKSEKRKGNKQNELRRFFNLSNKKRNFILHVLNFFFFLNKPNKFIRKQKKHILVKLRCRFDMAASANPVGNNNNQEGSSAAQKSTANGVSVNSSNNGGNSPAVIDTSQTASALRHNSGISTEWTPEEQSILEDLLAKSVSSV